MAMVSVVLKLAG